MAVLYLLMLVWVGTVIAGSLVPGLYWLMIVGAALLVGTIGLWIKLAGR